MTKLFVRSDVRSFLDAMAANPPPVFNDQLIAMVRQLPADAMVGSDLPVGELGAVLDLTMPGPAGPIALRLFDPRSEREPGPVVVFFHGGGFVVGNIETHASLAAEISRQLDLPVVSVEYRMAPEHPWPGAPDDAEAAARWIAENGSAFGRHFTHLVLCGDSAGGTLTLVTALALRDRPAARPVIVQIPIYPKADSSRVYPSSQAYADDFGLGEKNMTYYDQAYRGDVHHWRHSPILADLAGVPATLLVTASLDPLRDEGRAFAARAIKAGVDMNFVEVRGTIHGFATYRAQIPSARIDLQRIMRAARLMIDDRLEPTLT